MIALLKSQEYGWTPSKNDDRLVIFTERIETMRYLAENLKKDLGLKDNQLEVMHGGMSDKELQRIEVSALCRSYKSKKERVRDLLWRAE